MLEEKIKLKNGKFVTIDLLETKDNFLVSAVDENGEIVGKCVFEICSRTVKELPKMNFGRKYIIKDTNIKNGAITCLPIVKKIEVSPKVCKLCQIEITSDNFFQIGLGSMMMKKMEEFVRTKNCNEINGWFFAYGNFWYGSKDFYIKNGFSFEKDDSGMINIKKELQNTPRLSL